MAKAAMAQNQAELSQGQAGLLRTASNWARP
jgi:hypothetical protein